jgi:hypothetical protein
LQQGGPARERERERETNQQQFVCCLRFRASFDSLASSRNLDRSRFDGEDSSLRVSSCFKSPSACWAVLVNLDDPLPPCRDDNDYGRHFRVLLEEVRHRCRCTAIHFVLNNTIPFFFQRHDAMQLKPTWRIAPHILHYVATKKAWPLRL